MGFKPVQKIRTVAHGHGAHARTLGARQNPACIQMGRQCTPKARGTDSQSRIRTGWAAIRAFHSAGPVWWTEVPRASTATVTGISFTSNS